MSVNELETAFQLIDANPTVADFVGPRSESLIATAEETLGLSFPPTYRQFLRLLGTGGGLGEEFYGVVNDDFEHSSVPDAIWLTLKQRQVADLPESLIVVADNGLGGWYAIDTSTKNPDGDSPVIDWFSNEQPTEIVAEDFGAFLLQRLRQALDRR